MRKWLILVLGCFISLSHLEAQDEPMTQNDVVLQSKFIDAQKYILLGDFEKATNILNELRTRMPENAAVAYQQARLEDARRNGTLAIEHIERAISLEPDNVWYVQTKANMAETYDMYDIAAKTYEQLIQLKPERTSYYKNWAFHELRAGNRKKAIEILDQLESVSGIDPETSLRKHQLYTAAGETNKAEQELIKLTEAFPEQTDFLHDLAAFYEETEDRRKALKVYERIAEINPDDARATLRLAQGEPNEGDDSAPLKVLSEIASNDQIDLDNKMPEIIPYVQELARTREPELGNSLLNLVDNLRDVHPASPKLDALEGDILYHLGRLPESIEAYQRSLAAYDGVYPVWEQLMYALYETQNFEELGRVSMDAVDFFPNKASAYYMHGRSLEQEGKLDEAIRVARRGLMVAARNKYQQAEIYNLLGDLNLANGDRSAAVEAWTKSKETGYLLKGVNIKIEKHSPTN